MFGVGFWELILLFLIGLIVLGPERLPQVANQLGKWLGQARRMTRVLKRQLEDELNMENALDIRPPRKHKPLPAVPPPSTPRDDDKWSPAHDADSPGTGVGNTGSSGTGQPAGVEPASGPADEEPVTPAGNEPKTASDPRT